MLDSGDDLWSRPSPRSIHPLGNLEPKHALLHPSHREEVIEGGKEAVPDPVMALAREARIVRDRDFGDGEAFDLEKSR